MGIKLLESAVTTAKALAANIGEDISIVRVGRGFQIGTARDLRERFHGAPVVATVTPKGEVIEK